MLRLAPASFPGHLDQVRGLFREYVDSLGVDIGFQNFEREIQDLPGAYAPPSGRLLLAWWDDELAGCVALRSLAPGKAEMKRLYVRFPFQGLGIGKALAEQAIDEARAAGFKEMRLDTLSFMVAAQTLYRSLGFRETPAYYHNPLPGTVFMALELTESTEP